MDRKAAKELAHIEAWLDRVAEIVMGGRDAYLDDALLQEAGDSLMMKLGEAANRLSKVGVLAPDGVEWAIAVANRNLHHPPVRPDQPLDHVGDPGHRPRRVACRCQPCSRRRGASVVPNLPASDDEFWIAQLRVNHGPEETTAARRSSPTSPSSPAPRRRPMSSRGSRASGWRPTRDRVGYTSSPSSPRQRPSRSDGRRCEIWPVRDRRVGERDQPVMSLPKICRATTHLRISLAPS